VPPAPLVEFGISRVTPNHYLLGVSSAPLLLAMNRKTFDGLPERARQIIARFSGQWTAERYIETYLVENDRTIAALMQDPNRTVVFPSPSDTARARAAFTSEVEAWAAADPRHRELLARTRAELDRIRAGTVAAR
jgi:TRAP-type C4-dicarboxylate transport system substrate-binding protein